MRKSGLLQQQIYLKCLHSIFFILEGSIPDEQNQCKGFRHQICTHSGSPKNKGCHVLQHIINLHKLRWKKVLQITLVETCPAWIPVTLEVRSRGRNGKNEWENSTQEMEGGGGFEFFHEFNWKKCLSCCVSSYVDKWWTQCFTDATHVCLWFCADIYPCQHLRLSIGVKWCDIAT